MKFDNCPTCGGTLKYYPRCEKCDGEGEYKWDSTQYTHCEDCQGSGRKLEPEPCTRTVREIAEGLNRDVAGRKERENRIELFEDLCTAVDDSDFNHTVDDIQSALWALMGGRPEQRKVQEVRRGIKFHEMSIEKSTDDDGEAWHCSQCGSVICVNPDTGGPVCPKCKTSPLKR